MGDKILITKTGFPAAESVLTPAQLQRHAERTSNVAEAGAEAFPGPLRGAFAGEPRRLHGFTLQPVNAWLLAILSRIDSPLLAIVKIYRRHAEAMAAAAGPEVAAAVQVQINRDIEREVTLPADAGMETVFAFVTDVEALQGHLDRGRAEFTAAARKTVGRLHPAALSELEELCGEHFADSFKTALNVSAKEQPGASNGTVFTQPPAERKTG